ncbi:MAG: type II secretion system major pseudopilin GspG [Candidatus Babeliales bacterium]|nr:type II secretion system major pseudopilin GspG [Candidatus Babeliales bacterium]
MTNVSTNNAQKGFTLIELLIAITILGILSAVLVPVGMNLVENSRITGTQSNLSALESAITQYQLAVGSWPTRLKDLVIAPSDEKLKKRWSGPYLKKVEVPEDAWGNNYQYKVSPPGAPHPYELYSFGKNGKGAPKTEWIDVWKV